jgi:mRNA interferase MazF
LPQLPFLDRESVANVQGLGSLPTVRLERKIGRLSAGIVEQIKDALAFALDSNGIPDECSAAPAVRSAQPLGRVDENNRPNLVAR